MSEGIELEAEQAVVVLAAGKGTRMKSRRAKVLHEICGLPMLGYIQRVAEQVSAARLIVVVGRDADEVREAYGEHAEFVLQAEQLGTGHAVKLTEPTLRDFRGDIMVLYGDTPLLRASTLERMRALKRETGADLVMLTASGEIPGRVVRDAEGRVERIIEAQDATPEELAIEERNTGVYLVSSSLLWTGLANIKSHNRQGELYLTDVVGYAVQEGYRVEALWLEDAGECLGVNDREELAEAARIMRGRINSELMAHGVSLIDPATTYIDATVEIGNDTTIEPGCVITGQTVIGQGVHIKSGCYLEDSRLDDGVVFGPYSHLRPNSHLMAGVKIGNFVEVKNSTLGPGSKSAHLTYIGDATVGSDVNFGCGSVVVNYDGYEKHRTIVGDEVFVGCNANLIAPVEIEPKAFLAAGSTITKAVPRDALGVARARQVNLPGWVARKEGRASSAQMPAEASAKKAGKPAKRKNKKEKKATKKAGSKASKKAKKKPSKKAKKKAKRKLAAKAGKAGKAGKKATRHKKAAAKKRPAKSKKRPAGSKRAKRH
jgi:bifunctional UDP-N-acetylglucosamine pyrophosphorylase/glucosamine-1-phosphate N-acetyltransferase